MIDGISKSDINETEQRLDELQIVLEKLRCLATEVWVWVYMYVCMCVCVYCMGVVYGCVYVVEYSPYIYRPSRPNRVSYTCMLACIACIG